jgi:hypothetical protein
MKSSSIAAAVIATLGATAGAAVSYGADANTQSPTAIMNLTQPRPSRRDTASCSKTD